LAAIAAEGAPLPGGELLPCVAAEVNTGGPLVAQDEVDVLADAKEHAAQYKEVTGRTAGLFSGGHNHGVVPLEKGQGEERILQCPDYHDPVLLFEIERAYLARQDEWAVRPSPPAFNSSPQHFFKQCHQM